MNVYAPHNVEHTIARANAILATGPRRILQELNWRKLRREERRTWRRMDLCLAVSEVDAERMRVGGARRVEVCPNGTDPVRQLPLKLRTPDEPLQILFVGDGRYRPNARGLGWFVSEVLPRIGAVVPARLDVVGHPPRLPIRSPEEVNIAGVVPELESWYERAHVVVAPLFEGSGTRLKIVEALAYGRPVVSTALGAEGLPLRAGEHFRQADEPDDFASAVIEIARQVENGGGELSSMLTAGRNQVESLFWPRITSGLIQLYQELVEGPTSVARPVSPRTGIPGEPHAPALGNPESGWRDLDGVDPEGTRTPRR